jgi:beta-phosphoglucomutase-like phosphatase (HAD superfamily)
MTGVGAVIFDFNGVLVDDEDVHFALFREILAQAGVFITRRDYHERYLGYDDRGCFEAALVDASRNANREQLDQMVAQKGRRYIQIAEHGLRFFPSAAETLAMVAACWPVAICSGALRAEIEYALRRLHCLEHVAVIISAEDTDRCKPDPEGYQLALAALRANHRSSRCGLLTAQWKVDADLDAINCLVVEDSLAGVASAKAAGMRTVGVPNTYTRDQLHHAGADLVINGLATLTPAWIDSQFGS